MSLSIPLHALVVVLTPILHPSIVTSFASHEIVSAAQIAYELWGDEPRPEHAQTVHDELRRRIALKLSFGERVLLHAAGMSQEDRCAWPGTRPHRARRSTTCSTRPPTCVR